jgi:hypothetical protein
MNQKSNNPGRGKVFILSLHGAEIVFLPETNEIVSVLKSNATEPSALPTTEAAVRESGKQAG